MTNEEKMNKYINRNLKLYPTFLALIFDVLFVWTISTMFFTSQKGLTYSQVVTLDSLLMLFGCILSIPLNSLFRKVPSLQATRIGSIGYAVYLLLCIFGNNYATFVVAQVFLAAAYIICGLRGNDVLVESLALLKKDKEYPRIFGKGLSVYYVFESIGAVLIAYVYNWRPYAAYWISLAVVGCVILYSFLFVEPKKFEKNIEIDVKADKKVKTKETEKPDSYFKILSSSFFAFLLIYMFFMRGSLSITMSNYKIYLQQLIEAKIIPMAIFGYLVGLGKMCCAIASRYQFKLNLRHGVKSLVIFTTLTILGFFINALIYILFPTSIFTIVAISIVSLIQVSIFPPCRIFINNYMQVCMKSKNINKGYTIRTLVEYLGYAAISAMYAGLLAGFNDNYGITSLVYMAILCVPLIISSVLFIRALIKKHAQKFTIIKDEYTND